MAEVRYGVQLLRHPDRGGAVASWFGIVMIDAAMHKLYQEM